MPPRANVRIKALLEEYRGRVALIEPANLKMAAGHFETSISLNPKAGNTSVCQLYQTYRQLSLETSARDLLNRFDGNTCE